MNGGLWDIFLEIVELNGEEALKKTFDYIVVLFHLEIWLASDYLYAARSCIEIVIFLAMLYYGIYFFYYWYLCKSNLLSNLIIYHKNRPKKRID